MKKFNLNFISVLFSIATLIASDHQVLSQSISDYELQTNVFYRDASIESVTEYMKERCPTLNSYNG